MVDITYYILGILGFFGLFYGGNILVQGTVQTANSLISHNHTNFIPTRDTFQVVPNEGQPSHTTNTLSLFYTQRGI